MITVMIRYFCTFIALFLTAVPLLCSQIKIPEVMTFERSVSLGAVIDGCIPILNTGKSVATVKISLADYMFNAAGQTFYLEPGSNERSNGHWITLSAEQLQIPPHTSMNLHYKIHVPQDVSLTGTYWSIILIEPVDTVVFEKRDYEQLDVQTIVRYGFQVITHIQNSGSYDLKVIKKDLVRNDGKTTLTVDVENTGTRMLSPALHMEVFNALGKCEKKYELCKRRIYPACSARYSVDLCEIPPGKYPTLIIFDQGDKTLFGTQYTLEISKGD